MMSEDVLMRMAKDEVNDVLSCFNLREEQVADACEVLLPIALAYLKSTWDSACAAGREEHDGTCWLRQKFIGGSCNKVN
jgi:hypothetical protein